jgi:hypothetical protein
MKSKAEGLGPLRAVLRLQTKSVFARGERRADQSVNGCAIARHAGHTLRVI